ncbi:MAG: 1-deoxy-D-xylulose-5-phosphate reductoisomerase [Clostridia bacterium]|nr:1-deoxy-D-xylulose-5-phosphate reductoisomerase [Clostridia bacterium]
MEKKTLCILGSTGSIGTQCLDIIEQTDFRVCALAAARNIDLLEQQIRRFHPEFAAVEDEQKAADLKVRVADTATKVLSGRQGVLELAAMGHHTVLNALVGIAGLLPTLTALEAGSHIALANKETLVTGGALVMDTARKLGRNILPVDSEHSAVFQCIQNSPKEDLQSVVLTASGGPFLGKTRAELATVTKEQALKHPNWSMGQKISIDSATMMNKGLEVIEALHLFDVTPDQIQVVIHPESIVHSLVEWKDGAMLAQLSHPDMRVPIQYALTYPHRIPSPIKRLSLGEFGRLTFCQPDRETFGCLAAAEEAIRLGGLFPAAVNGANEQAVAMFLGGKIGFLQIEEAVRLVLTASFDRDYQTVEQVLQADATARELVLQHFN